MNRFSDLPSTATRLRVVTRDGRMQCPHCKRSYILGWALADHLMAKHDVHAGCAHDWHLVDADGDDTPLPQRRKWRGGPRPKPKPWQHPLDVAVDAEITIVELPGLLRVDGRMVDDYFDIATRTYYQRHGLSKQRTAELSFRAGLTFFALCRGMSLPSWARVTGISKAVARGIRLASSTQPAEGK